MYKVKRFSQFESREFTKAEKDAFKEIYKMTNGFRKVPTSAHPRDVFRFQKLTDDLLDLSSGRVKGIDRENAKTLFKNLGMDKSANQVDKVLDKYTNKRALARLGKRKVEVDGYNTTAKKSNYLGSVKDKNLDVFNINKRDYAKVIKDSDHYGAVRKFRDLELSSKPADESMMKKMDDYASKLNVDVSKPGYGKSFHKVKDVNLSPDKSKVLNLKGEVTLGDHANEATYGHELGHHRSTSRRMRTTGVSDPYKLGKVGNRPSIKYLDRKTGAAIPYKGVISYKNDDLGKISEVLSTISEENAASSYSLARLRKMGASEKDINSYKKKLDAALDTYIQGAREDLKYSSSSKGGFKVYNVPERYIKRT